MSQNMDEMPSNHFEELLDMDISRTDRKIRHHTKHNGMPE